VVRLNAANPVADDSWVGAGASSSGQTTTPVLKLTGGLEEKKGHGTWRLPG